MKQTLIELFTTYSHEIIFFHVLSAIIWVGGMIAIRLAVHPNIQQIEEPHIRLGRTLAIMKQFFNIVIPFILILLLTAVVMILALKSDDTTMLMHLKEGVWTIMTVNFIAMYIKRQKAQKLFDTGELSQAKEMLSMLPKLMLPVNIILGLIALWLGVSLRGF